MPGLAFACAEAAMEERASKERLRPNNVVRFMFGSTYLSAEKNRHSHVLDLILKLLDLVNVTILILQYVFKHFTGGKVCNVPRHNNRSIVCLNGALFS